MQYFKPFETHLFAGDCMPFFHHGDGVFHLYYLQDENHHGALGGLGGHQWAHATTSDLVHWTHHPLAIAITHDWEGSICTGSTFFHQGTFYGFYATRLPDWTQHLALAISSDGVTFDKLAPNPLASPLKGYHPLHYRDPFVFQDERTQVFHMLITALLEDYPLDNLGGCLAHLTSPDLRQWTLTTPFLIPGFPTVPECPDYFFWHGWYYLLFSNDGVTRYRMSRDPLGPWMRPKSDVLDSPAMRVMKTAPFSGNRRIGAAWIGTRENDQDSGRFQWGGHVVLREIFQHDDGTLGTKLIPELIPPTDASVSFVAVPLTEHVAIETNRIHLNASQGIEVARISDVPRNVVMTVQVRPNNDSGRFGLRLKGNGNFQSGYDLGFNLAESRVDLFDETISCVEGLSKPFTLEIIIKDDIIDVCIDQRRCVINRCPTHQGDDLFLFAQDANVVFERMEIKPIRP